MSFRRVTMVLAALAAVMLASGAAGAVPARQADGISLQVRAGYGDEGLYLIGEWVPVWVTVSNPAGGSQARVRVEVDSISDNPGDVFGTYAREVDLPPQSRKEVTLYAYTTGYVRNLRVRLVEGSTVRASATATVEPLTQPANVLVGVASSDPSLLNALNGEFVGHREEPPQDTSFPSRGPALQTSGRARVAHISLRDIPTLSQSLDNLGMLVVDDADTGTLSGEQRAALEAWVARGGMLLAFGRPAGGGALSGIADLLPVTLGGSTAAESLQDLGDLVARPFPVADSMLAPAAALRREPDVQARSLASEGDRQLAAIRDLGAGHVVYVGLSPALPPLKTWDGLVPIMQRVMAEHPVRVSVMAARRLGTQPYLVYPSSGGNVFDLPGLELPSPLLIGFFMLAYIIVVGPVTFLALRRARRLELAWLVVPALALLFSVGAYVLSYGAKGGDRVSVQASIHYTSPDTPQASTTQFLGVFSANRGTYRMEAGAESAITEANTYGYSARPDTPARTLGGDPTRLIDVNINTWSLRGFMAESAGEARSPLELNLTLGANAIVGSARNRSEIPLEDVALLFGGAVQYVGGLAPGEERPVHMTVSIEALQPGLTGDMLPPPPGVIVGTYGPYTTDPRSRTDEARRYFRRREMVDIALGSTASYLPPTEMEVLALAWGAPAGTGFHVLADSRTERSDLWVSRQTVRSSTQDASGSLGMGRVPFSIYVPGNAPSWLVGPVTATGGMKLDSYADLLVRLPVGARPQSVRFGYRLDPLRGSVRVLVRDPRQGRWEPLGELETGTTGEQVLEIPQASRYTGPAGDLTVRLVVEPPGESLVFRSIGFSMDGGAGP